MGGVACAKDRAARNQHIHSNFVLDHNISVSLQSYERIHDLNSNKEPCIFTNIDINYLPEKSQMIESTPIIICGRPVKTTVMRSIKKIYNDIAALYRLNPYSYEYVIAEAGANGELVTKIPSSFTLIDNAAIQTENEIPSELFSEYDTEYNKYRVSVSVNNHDYFSTGEFYKFIDNKSIEYVGSICPVLLWKGCYIRLEEFEKVLSESPLVNKACFEFMLDQEKKVRLVAYFVPTASETTSDLISDYLSDRLPSLLYPCQVVKLSEFPYDIQNRLYREMLPNPYKSKIVSSDMNMQILDHINEYGSTINIDKITQENLNKPFSEVGINSLILIEMIVYLEEKLGLRLPDEILNFTLYETIQDFIERICSEAEYYG